MRPLRPVSACTLDQNLAALEWSPDGTGLAWVDLDGGVGVLRAGVIRRFMGTPASCLAWSPDNRHFLTGGEDGVARVWDATAADGAPRSFAVGGWIAAAVWGPTCIAIAAGKNVQRWTTDGQPVGEPFTLPGTVSALVRDPARDGFIAAGYGQAVAFAAVSGSTRTFTYKGSMLALSPSPDGRHVAIGCQDNSVVVWQRNLGPDGGAEPEPLRMGGFPGKVQHLAWGDGPTLFTAGGDALASWSFAGRGPAGQDGAGLPGHAGRILAVQTARRGRIMASLGQEGRVARLITWTWRRAWEPIASAQLDASMLALRADGRGFAAAGASLLLAEIPD